MNEERITILKMLEEGKVSVDEATALLEAVERPQRAGTQEGREATPAVPRTSSPQRADFPPRQAERGRIDLEKLTHMKMHDVTPRFIQAMSEVGFADLPLEKLIEMRIHDITPEYVRAVRAAGFTPTVDELIAMRIHGLTPEFYAEMQALGFADLGIDELVELRIHGVTPAYVQEMRAINADLTVRQLVDMRLHGVDAGYLREMQAFV